MLQRVFSYSPYFVLLTMLSFPVQAQVSATLSGLVTDPSGVPVSGAAVTVRNIGTGASQTTSTDNSGRYQVPSLPLGHYEIRVKAPKFPEEVRTRVELVGGQGATVDIGMRVGTPDACASGHEFATTDCTLTWHGVTVYGTYDVGAGWVSHGLPQNPYNYEGSSLVKPKGNGSRFLVEPDNLSQTGVGIRGRVKFAEDWFVVFNASTGIDPQSGLLSN